MICSFCGQEIGNAQVCPLCGERQAQRQTSMAGVPASTGWGALGAGAGAGAESAGATSLEKTTKTISTQQFQKSAKVFGGTIQALVQGGPHAAVLHLAMEGLSKIFEIFAPLIDLLTSPLDVVTGILQMALVPTIQALAPLVGDFNVMLIQNKDSIIAVVTVMSPLFMGLKFWTVLMTENKDIIKILIKELGFLIAEFGELAMIILEDEDVMYIFIQTARGLSVILRGVIMVVKGVVIVLKSFKNILRDVKNFISTISFRGGGGRGGGGDGGDVVDDLLGLIGLQEGAVVTRPTLSITGEAGPEAVIPLRELPNLMAPDTTNSIEVLRNSELQIDLLTEIRDLSKVRRR